MIRVLIDKKELAGDRSLELWIDPEKRTYRFFTSSSFRVNDGSIAEERTEDGQTLHLLERKPRL